jgi:hypothetical protein
MDIESLAKELILKNMNSEQQLAVLEGIKASVAQAKEVQKQRIGENVGLVVDALKKIESDIRSRYDEVGNAIEKRVATIKDGKDGKDGRDGRNGKDGRDGKQGVQGVKGEDGRDGRDGMDGIDGVSVTSARIDFDGSLIISLSSGIELNVGEVVAPDLAESIKVITNGGGTSQSVLDTLASLQTQINNLIPSQTGNSGKYLTTNGTALSWASVAGGLSYQGTWNASTNTPTLASSTGTNGYYYIVATAGSTNLNGITDWQVGDWLLFNGSVWQKIDQSETLQFVTSTDTSVTVTTTGSTADLAVYSAPRLVSTIRNETGATLTKGTVVYISGASGNKPTVSKAIATSDSTSAQTFALVLADISNNNNGTAILAGEISGLDTSAFAAGTQLYLSSTTAGAYTSTKQYAPNHLVYVGVVTRSHVNQGSIEVRIQNGYELDELHNVSAQSPSNGQTIIYNATTSLWEKANLTAGTAISVTNGAGSITVANTGVTSAVAGTGISVSGATGAVTITNSAPDQTVALTGAGTTSITGTYPNFTITSNDAYTGTVTSVTGTSPVASSGGTTPSISLASGYGDTQNPYASKTANYFLASPNGSSGVPTFRAVVAADIPTLNQNTTGTASNVTGTVAIANGGTGQTTATAAFNALAPSQTSNSGKYLTTDGTNTSWATVSSGTVTSVAATVPSFLSISGSPITTSGTLAISYSGTALPVANGGTGLTSLTSNYIPYGNGTGSYSSSSNFTYNGTKLSIGSTNATDTITISDTGTSGANLKLIGNGATTPNKTIRAYNGSLAVVNNAYSAEIFNLSDSGVISTSTWNGATIGVAYGGTGLTSTPSNGQIDIGNGTGFTRTTLTAGSNITITNGAGSITIASTGGGSSGPAFSAYANASQTISLATLTKVALNTKVFDTNSNFDNTTNYRFTPTVSGYYQINAKIRGTSTSSGMQLLLVEIYKNGSGYCNSQFNTSSPAYAQEAGISAVIYMNGSTDYIELYGAIYGSGTPSFNYATSDITSSMSGCFLRS